MLFFQAEITSVADFRITLFDYESYSCKDKEKKNCINFIGKKNKPKNLNFPHILINCVCLWIDLSYPDYLFETSVNLSEYAYRLNGEKITLLIF
jgi:hypothetical protein